MDALIFVDTNILLDFYRVRNSQSGLALLKLIEKHKDILITSSQVEMEYKKNRQRVMLESIKAIKTPDWNGLTPPAFLATAKPVQRITKSKKEIVTQQARLKKRIASILDNPRRSDPVFQSLSRVFRHSGKYNLSRDKNTRFAVRRLARKRWMLGYPPRKRDDTSMGDAVNWEWIIQCALDSGKDIIIVSRDSDYGCVSNGKHHLNDWLRCEFKERVSRKRHIVLTDLLAEAFKQVAVTVSPAAEREEKTLVAERSKPGIVACGLCGIAME